MPTHPSSCALGSDPELSLNPALEDERTTLMTHLRRKSDMFACQVADDATPEAIADDEPTVPIIIRRTGLFHGAHTRPIR
jgi:hypothetical protein